MADGHEQVKRWRQMAEECRAKAEQMADAGARSSFLHMAKTYESMADRFVRLASGTWLQSLAEVEPPVTAAPDAAKPGEAGQQRR